MSKSQRLLSLILMMPDVSCPGGNSLCRLGSPGNRCITNMKMLSPRRKKSMRTIYLENFWIYNWFRLTFWSISFYLFLSQYYYIFLVMSAILTNLWMKINWFHLKIKIYWLLINPLILTSITIRKPYSCNRFPKIKTWKVQSKGMYLWKRSILPTFSK